MFSSGHFQQLMWWLVTGIEETVTKLAGSVKINDHFLLCSALTLGKAKRQHCSVQEKKTLLKILYFGIQPDTAVICTISKEKWVITAGNHPRPCHHVSQMSWSGIHLEQLSFLPSFQYKLIIIQHSQTAQSHINTCPGWTKHKWTALSTGVNRDQCVTRSPRLPSEVMQDTHDHNSCSVKSQIISLYPWQQWTKVML